MQHLQGPVGRTSAALLQLIRDYLDVERSFAGAAWRGSSYKADHHDKVSVVFKEVLLYHVCEAVLNVLRRPYVANREPFCVCCLHQAS